MAEQVVELNPGESKLVSFEAVPHEARVYQVSVNGLQGSFTVIPIAAFIFTNPSVVRTSCGINPWCDAATYQCTILNLTDKPITHTLTLWIQRYSRTWGQWSPPRTILSFDLTLIPGEVFNYEVNGCQDIGGGNLLIEVFPDNNYTFWLEDGYGNQSAKVTVVGA